MTNPLPIEVYLSQSNCDPASWRSRYEAAPNLHSARMRQKETDYASDLEKKADTDKIIAAGRKVYGADLSPAFAQIEYYFNEGKIEKVKEWFEEAKFWGEILNHDLSKVNSLEKIIGEK